MTIDGNYCNTKGINIYSQQGINFKQQTNTATKPLPNDKFEQQTKKKSSKKTLWITLGTVATLAIGAIALIKHKKVQNNPQVDATLNAIREKVKITPLAEKIEFKEATSVEEARKFMKETLKIEHVDESIDLDTLNWINHALTDVSNSMKGKAKMPTSVEFGDLRKGALADTTADLLSNDFGRLRINKNMLTIEDEIIKHAIQPNGKKLLKGDVLISNIHLHKNGRFNELITKYYNNTISPGEKKALYNILGDANDQITYMCKENPLKTFELLAKKHPDLKLDLEKIGKESKEEQAKQLDKLLERLVKEKRPLNIEVNGTASEFKTLYHEMGHLQDTVINSEKLYAGSKARYNTNYVNHYYTKSNLERLLKEHPNASINNFPELKEFIENAEIQQTAGEVSYYAKSGIGEFVAETYAAMQEGRELSDSVKQLYKKYNGPVITNPVGTKKDNTFFYKWRGKK